MLRSAHSMAQQNSGSNNLFASRWAPQSTGSSTSRSSGRTRMVLENVHVGSAQGSNGGVPRHTFGVQGVPGGGLGGGVSGVMGTEGAKEKVSDDSTLQRISEVVNMDVDRVDPSTISSYVVLDTNVLLGNLDVIQQFASDLQRINMPAAIMIPGVVIQELDNQKTGRDLALTWSSRNASTWILRNLKDSQRVRGQSFKQTCQVSGKWTIRDKWTSNDDLIVDCCMFFRDTMHCAVLAVSADNNLCNVAESQGIKTLNPRQHPRFSSRDIATMIFGAGFPSLHLFSGYSPSYRSQKVNRALEEELGPQPAVVHHAVVVDEGMDIDEDTVVNVEPMPSHLLDSLHLQCVDHFSILVMELAQRVAPEMFSEAPVATGAALSMHAPRGARLRSVRDCVVWLGDPSHAKFPREEPQTPVPLNTQRVSRLADFLTRPYQPGGRRGQDWAIGDWYSCLQVLATIGNVWKDDGVRESLVVLEKHFELVFQTKMRPTGI